MSNYFYTGKEIDDITLAVIDHECASHYDKVLIATIREALDKLLRYNDIVLFATDEILYITEPLTMDDWTTYIYTLAKWLRRLCTNNSTGKPTHVKLLDMLEALALIDNVDFNKSEMEAHLWANGILTYGVVTSIGHDLEELSRFVLNTGPSVLYNDLMRVVTDLCKEVDPDPEPAPPEPEPEPEPIKIVRTTVQELIAQFDLVFPHIPFEGKETVQASMEIFRANTTITNVYLDIDINKFGEQTIKDPVKYFHDVIEVLEKVSSEDIFKDIPALMESITEFLESNSNDVHLFFRPNSKLSSIHVEVTHFGDVNSDVEVLYDTNFHLDDFVNSDWSQVVKQLTKYVTKNLPENRYGISIYNTRKSK